MEVEIYMPENANIKAVLREYPDMEHEEDDRYFVGLYSDDPMKDDDGKEIEWLTYDEAVELCGFVEGAVPGAECLIEGNGGWAQGMISRKDFSSLAISEEAKRDYKRTSNLYWKSFKRGQKTIRAKKRNKKK